MARSRVVATKKNGNGKGEADILTAILREIQKTNTKLDETKAELSTEIRQVRTSVDGLSARFDHFLLTAGDRIRRLEERVDALESDAG